MQEEPALFIKFLIKEPVLLFNFRSKETVLLFELIQGCQYQRLR